MRALALAMIALSLTGCGHWPFEREDEYKTALQGLGEQWLGVCQGYEGRSSRRREGRVLGFGAVAGVAARGAENHNAVAQFFNSIFDKAEAGE